MKEKYIHLDFDGIMYYTYFIDRMYVALGCGILDGRGMGVPIDPFPVIGTYYIMSRTKQFTLSLVLLIRYR